MGTTRRRRLQRHAIEAWRERARRLKLGADRLYLLGRDPRVPWYARVMALGIAAYVLSPIDLIPDFIPVLGHLDDLDFALRIPHSDFWSGRSAPEQFVHRFGYIVMDGKLVHLHDLYDHVESWRRFPLKYGLLSSSPLCFFVAQSDCLNAADQVAQCGVHQQVLQRVAVCSSD